MNAQTVASSKTKPNPKPYNVVVPKAKEVKVEAAPKERRILKIDLDSLIVNNGLTIREIIKEDSVNVAIDYTINAYLAPFSDSMTTSNISANLFIKVSEIKKSQFKNFKDKEVDRINKEIEEDDKRKADRIKQREDFKKQ